jgi:hypothetical protein
MVPQLIAAGTVAGLQIYSGVQANKMAKKQASLIEQQGALQKEEALQEAAMIRDEGKRFRQEQLMQYVSSGVEIQGTPLVVMAETAKMADVQAKAVEKRGYAMADLANANAKITRSQGKAEMIASFGKAVSSGVSTYASAGGK